MNTLMQCVLSNRGWTEAKFQEINTEPHAVPKDVDKLCLILKYYHDTQAKVVLLTDYDMDGLSAGVLGYAGLAELGFNVSLYLPVVSEGYGFHSHTIDKIKQQYPDVQCIVTADTGITCYDGVLRARELGIDILVTDHHKASGILHANVVVDPARIEDTESYTFTCGAAVLYQVLLYYAKHYATAYHTSQIRRLCVFAGLGTVSDGMTVYYENRRLILDALHILEYVYNDDNADAVLNIQGCNTYRQAFYGLYVLLHEMKKANNFVLQANPVKLQEDFIAFYIAPLFNSIKRMDGDVRLAYGIFFESSPHAKVQALLALNEARKCSVEEKWADLIEDRFPQPWAPYVYITDADSGIRGLLAQKMLEVTGKPVMVVASDGRNGYEGSGRCPYWYPFLDVACSEHWQAAGHNPAFGIGFDSEKGVEALIAFLEKSIPEYEPTDTVFVPDFYMSMFGTGQLDYDIATIVEYLNELPTFRPFGSGFSEPEGVLEIDTSACQFSIMGKKSNHLKVLLPQGVEVICWNQADVVRGHLQRVEPDRNDPDAPLKPYYISKDLPLCMRIVGKFQYGSFRGMQSVQFYGTIQEEDDDERNE